MSSLKATHAAHRVASDIHSEPTPELQSILQAHEENHFPAPQANAPVVREDAHSPPPPYKLRHLLIDLFPLAWVIFLVADQLWLRL